MNKVRKINKIKMKRKKKETLQRSETRLESFRYPRANSRNHKNRWIRIELTTGLALISMSLPPTNPISSDQRVKKFECVPTLTPADIF